MDTFVDRPNLSCELFEEQQLVEPHMSKSMVHLLKLKIQIKKESDKKYKVSPKWAVQPYSMGIRVVGKGCWKKPEVGKF